MESLIDKFIELLIVPSALLLVLGGLSCIIMKAFNLSGKAKLLICRMLMIMPLLYPIGSLVPNHHRVPLPVDKLEAIFSVAVKSDNDTTMQNSSPAAIQPQAPPIQANPQSPFAALNWKLGVAGAWFPLFIFFLLRSSLLFRKIKRLLKCANSVTDPAILVVLQQCKSETGLQQNPRLMTINHTLSPMTIGLFNPAVILPARLLSPEFREGLRFTLLHELKHIQRRDNWWLLFESLVCTVYFFHPVIHWAKRKIHEEWEHICDRHVVQVTNRPASYADFLLHEIWNHGCRTISPSLAAPLISKTNKTATRIHFILEKMKPTRFMKIIERIAVSTVLILFFSLFLCTAIPSADPNVEGSEGRIQVRSEAGGKSDPLPENVSIPVGARIFDWKVIDDSNIVIRTRFYGNFKATLAEGYPELSAYSKKLGFVSDWPYELDIHSRIILSNDDECRIQKLVPYKKEIRGFYEIY